MNLTHRIRWFLLSGGTDAEGGGTDGIGGFEEARREHPLAQSVDGRSRNTVRRYLRGGDTAATRKPGPKRPEKLDPYKTYIIDRMAAASPDAIPASVLLREIQERGYDGGYSRVKQFVRGLVPASAPEPVVRFEKEPGQRMQADWATVGKGAGKLKVFIATLGWSQWLDDAVHRS
jgi:transposase